MGRGHQESFTSNHEQGEIIPISNNGVIIGYANLTRNARERGEEVLESSIHFNIPSGYKNFSMTCRAVENGSKTSVVYQLSGT